MRVYLPATFSLLSELHDSGEFSVRSGWGFAVTPALEEFFISGDADELADIAFDEAARASIRLLSTGVHAFPHRRVVVSADLPDTQVTLAPEMGESVVKVAPPQVLLSQVVAIHVDIEDSEAATAAAIAQVDAADLGDEDAELAVGDALDNFMAWYDPIELPVLVALV